LQEDPNFHKYLQSAVLNTASDAVLGEPVNAAQFQITSGQLIQNAAGTNLYAIVEPQANSTVNKLKVTWSKTAATSGTFVWSGDTVEWSNPSITRPQNNVCVFFLRDTFWKADFLGYRRGLYARMQMVTRISTLTLARMIT
jgi:hypothetical protein